jgi:hypothetical protein
MTPKKRMINLHIAEPRLLAFDVHMSLFYAFV